MSDPAPTPDEGAVLYGIRSCDTVRRARRWLDAGRIAYRYHDLREHGLEPQRLTHWCEILDWTTLLNRRSTTWRTLPARRREAIVNADAAIALVLEHPTLLRRPLLAVGDTLYVGFDESGYRAALGHA